MSEVRFSHGVTIDPGSISVWKRTDEHDFTRHGPGDCPMLSFNPKPRRTLREGVQPVKTYKKTHTPGGKTPCSPSSKS